MPRIQDWLRLYSSNNLEIKLRAASVLIDRSPETPIDVLLEILEKLCRWGLGARTEKALLKRSDQDLVPKLIGLLQSKDHFVREVSCNILGQSGDRGATAHLLRMIDDPSMMVRRAAGFGLGLLKDPSSVADLKEQYYRHRDDDSNVVWALECALRELGEKEP